ncbi:oligopeptide transport system ATP-binding protein/dipeptide transport system ATP-binding protein [Scopulibacillus darangshiensis]|uniref:Oligopeptide transport system ATP-binding protein/dipeptide transport system ATP-binding protein n=1 Tax=Scopulibacillus darangshiensis TaxID=442528 RepID=A0A4R2P568_9BACL|nr:ABC transporter ATP-binding protein [Scopulibacillus darangshiensis]TCP29979.1 oligopeptide transport system ATP-binding protein/dipeptide transport system ATP-binding protein [Scopulibacillus darangshiensis]
MAEPMLSVENLHVSFQTKDKEVRAVRGVNFSLNKGETLAIVGESGSGKSVTAKSIMRLLPKHNTKVKEGRIIYEGRDLLTASIRDIQKIRGSDISMVFQDPMTSLNPTMKIGKQIIEGLKTYQSISKQEGKTKAAEMLKLVGIPNAEERLDAYPHQFSGGMRQRVGIAMALACNPNLLIADEPTTALDVTIQAQILELMTDMQKKTGTAIILITHDLGVVANMADRIAVMYAGEIIEIGRAEEIFYKPQHPYTLGLLQSMPKPHTSRTVPLIPIPGTPPDLAKLERGCPFAPRCPHTMKVCHYFNPEMQHASGGHSVSCWLQDKRTPKENLPAGVGVV